jgi:hypothetical protein
VGLLVPQTVTTISAALTTYSTSQAAGWLLALLDRFSAGQENLKPFDMQRLIEEDTMFSPVSHHGIIFLALALLWGCNLRHFVVKIYHVLVMCVYCKAKISCLHLYKYQMLLCVYKLVYWVVISAARERLQTG